MKKNVKKTPPNPSSRWLMASCLVTLASSLLAGSASAALLNLPLNSSASALLTFSHPSSVIYTYANTVFLESATPVAIRKDGSDALHFINPTGSTAPSETIMISARVDNAGHLLGGDGGHDLLVVGEVDLDGDGVIDASGNLLTGEVLQFGYQNVTNTDRFDFRFKITGGKLAELGIYQPGRDDLYLQITSENSSFSGSFDVDFAGLAKGNIWATPTTAIGDLVWDDLNQDGIQEGDEPGLNGVPVTLLTCSGAPVASTITENGAYSFSGLLPGDYRVQALLPENYLFSPQQQGIDDSKNSDVAPLTGLTDCVTLAAGENNTTLDAGVYLPLPSVSINKFTNGQDAYEAPGPEILVGAVVNWTYVVTNTGNVELNNVTVDDDQEVSVSCPQTTLVPGEYTTCTASGMATIGQYENIGTVTASFNGTTYTASAVSHYFGVEPLIDVTKEVSVNGGTWHDANSPTGADVPIATSCGAASAQAGHECSGGITSLTLAYQGSTKASVTIKDKNAQVLFCGPVKPGKNITFSGKAASQTMTEAITVYVNNKYHASLKTDCSQPIGPGYVHGDFAVVDGQSYSGGVLGSVSCEEQTPAPCQSCSGRVNKLTMEYEGSSGYVRVVDKENRELVGKTYMKKGQRFTFSGKDFDDTMTDEVKVYLNGSHHCSFNTSSSEPIGPGHVQGRFKVVSGKSSAGGELCPVSKDGSGYELPEVICTDTPAVADCTPERVSFKIQVQNTGNVALSGVTLADTPSGLGTCAVPATLNPGDSFQCLVGPLEAENGVHTNTATATGQYNGSSVADTDSASYLGQAPQCGLSIVKTANRPEVPRPVFDDGSCFDHDGYDKEGYDSDEQDKDGYDRDGFNKSGRCRKGHSQDDHERYGYDREGYDQDGYDRTGCDRSGYDRHGFDKEGYDQMGFNKEDQCREGHSKDHHKSHGVNKHGYDLDGFNAAGYNKSGYDHQGYDRDNCDKEGYDRQGWDQDGNDRVGHHQTERETGCNLPADSCATANKVTYVYTVTNTGSAVTNVIVNDDKLGLIGKIPSLGAGKSTTLTRTACVTESTTNVATVSLEGDATCSATAQATVNAVCRDDAASEHEGYSHDGYDDSDYDKKGYDSDGYDRNGYDGNGESKSRRSASGSYGDRRD